jgi:hypothetical protein
MTTVAVCSLFRNSAATLAYYRAALSAQARPGLELVFSFIEGDSSDDTWDELQRWAREDSRVVLSKIDVEPLADFDERIRQWARLGNACVEQLAGRAYDHVLWCESDLSLPLDLVPQLVSAAQAPGVDVVAPAIFLGGMFYDTWGFRDLTGTRFENAAPFHRAFPPHGLMELASVGSCVLFPRKLFDARVRFRGEHENGLLVGVCNDARARGMRVWMDSRVCVVHPTTLWKRQQYTLAHVDVACSDQRIARRWSELAREIETELALELGAINLPGDHPVFADVHARIAQRVPRRKYALSARLVSEAEKRYALVIADEGAVNA